MIIAIDGPAGSGKSTVAKILAKNINFEYLDTGAMYRTVSYYFIKNKIDLNILENTEKIKEIINQIKIDIKNGEYYLNGENVNQLIRSNEVNQIVSNISANKEIRNFLVTMQREIAQNKDCILDGRDIGTIVFPNANYKFFLEASPEERAKRRYKEEIEKGMTSTYEEILESIKNRDYIDRNRKESPLKQAEDAVLVDTSVLNIEQVVNIIEEKVKI